MSLATLFEPRTPVYSGTGEELQKVQRLLTDNHVPFKLRPDGHRTRVFVKRSLADKSEMLIRDAKARHWLW